MKIQKALQVSISRTATPPDSPRELPSPACSINSECSILFRNAKEEIKVTTEVSTLLTKNSINYDTNYGYPYSIFYSTDENHKICCFHPMKESKAVAILVAIVLGTLVVATIIGLGMNK